MKTKRRISALLALVVALVMVLGMSVNVLAATTITIGTKTGNQVDLQRHSFTAYQLFKGNQSQSGELGNVEWGTGINGADFLTALKADSTVGTDFASCSTAVQVAEKIAAYGSAPAKAQKIAEIARRNITSTGTALSSGENNMADGYYLIVDTTNPASTEGFVYNKAVLGLTKNITINPKNEVPKIEKKVEDINDSTTTEDGIAWQDSADHDIGDTVPYKITVNIPADAKTYQDDYILTISDTMSNGLTFNSSSVVIKLIENNGTEKTLVKGTDFTETTADYSGTGTYEGGNVVTWKTSDLRVKLGGEFAHTLVVTYNCTLNENAKHGTPGNPNKVGLKFSNKPDWIGDGNPPEGTTPEDTVIVFTYKTEVNKTDNQGTALPNAGFTLYKRYSSAAKLPAGVTNEYSTLAALTTLEAGQIWGKVKEIPASASVSKFTFPGLDDGDYILVESETPAGYNSIAPIKFTITATHDIESDNPALKSLSGVATTGTITFTATLPDGKLTTNVVNNKGVILPETGGMGTTIFTVVGLILAGGAAILLIARKRSQR
jgi:fimbrial isopeptide formation D2 family protein/LPXTG-motif cell wall-anchored protein